MQRGVRVPLWHSEQFMASVTRGGKADIQSNNILHSEAVYVYGAYKTGRSKQPDNLFKFLLRTASVV
jgi:hypothetical protein